MKKGDPLIKVYFHHSGVGPASGNLADPWCIRDSPPRRPALLWRKYPLHQSIPKYLPGLLLVLGLLLTAAHSSGQPKSPHQSVREITDHLLEKLIEIQPLFETDPDAFFAEVDSALEAFIDFEGFARSVMAKYYRRANDEQREHFTGSFRNALIRTYAKALVEFDNQKVIVLEGGHLSKDRASVRLEVHGKDGIIYPVDYSLVLIGDEWKLRNVVINGINIGLTFRSQFSSYMQKYRNEIDVVIKNWNVAVES